MCCHFSRVFVDKNGLAGDHALALATFEGPPRQGQSKRRPQSSNAASRSGCALKSPYALQAISNFRANLSNEDSQTNGLYNDDQNILAKGTNNSIICPSNGYTFPRSPPQVR